MAGDSIVERAYALGHWNSDTYLEPTGAASTTSYDTNMKSTAIPLAYYMFLEICDLSTEDYILVSTAGAYPTNAVDDSTVLTAYSATATVTDIDEYHTEIIALLTVYVMDTRYTRNSVDNAGNPVEQVFWQKALQLISLKYKSKVYYRYGEYRTVERSDEPYYYAAVKRWGDIGETTTTNSD
jgi:hypothetical protein